MSKEIRILHVLGSLNRGGAETMIMNIYRNIDRSKIQFDFIVHTNEKCDYNDEILEYGGKIFNIPRYTGKNHFKYKRAWKEFFNSYPEYKVIHGHMRSTAAIYLRIAKQYGLVTIAHSHSTASRGNVVEQIVKKIIQFPIRYRSDYLFACSNKAGKWLFGKNFIKKDNYKVIKNAIDIEKYTFNEVKRNEIRKKLNIQNKFVVGHVGSFTYPKNHKFLIDVFHEIQKQEEDSVLLLIGDGVLRSQIEEQIKNFGIDNKVIMTGVVSNVNDYMQAMDVFVFPSIFEGLGMAVIEAQAAGLQCIVSENIPKEAYITDQIKNISLHKKYKIWVNQILKYTDLKRKNEYEKLKNNGYYINDVASALEKFYLYQYNR